MSKTPLSIELVTRHGMRFILDGVQDDTRVHLSGLDDVDKAALRVLLQQALREMEPRVSGGTFVGGGIQPGVLHVTGGSNTTMIDSVIGRTSGRSRDQ